MTYHACRDICRGGQRTASLEDGTLHYVEKVDDRRPRVSEDDLVLGIVQGYTWTQIEPWVVSLLATGYAGHICLMYHDIPAEALSSLKAAGIEMVRFPLATLPVPGRRRTVRNALVKLHRSPIGKHRLVSRVSRAGIERVARLSRDPHRTKARILQSVLGLNMMRSSAWYLYLIRHRSRFKRVMLSDVRDVLFQRNPFEFAFDGTLCVFLQEDTIGTCEHTGPLVRDRYGSTVFHEIESRSASCSGVTIGSTDAILHYLRCLIDESMDPGDRYNQGMHNVLLYRGAFDPVRVFRNGAGPVLTMAQISPSALRFDHEGYLVNADGTIINVLHQYDRHVGKNGIRLERTAGTFRLTSPVESHQQ